MHLMHEDLARAHSALRLEEAVHGETGSPFLVVAHRAGCDGPSRPAMRARRLLAPPPSSDEPTATGLTETPGGRGTTRPTRGTNRKASTAAPR